MSRAPRHVQPFAKPAVGGVDVPGKFGPNHALWKIECLCGGSEFDLLKSDLPQVVATCGRCGREIRVYDIREYPAATAYSAAGPLVPIAGRVEVFAMYEYSELDEGEEFDPDGISWCQVFVRKPGSSQVTMVVDDETA